MGTIVIDHDQTGTSQVQDPEHEFAMLTGRSTILADTRTELVAELIGGYADLNTTAETAWARHSTAVALADRLAEILLSTAIENGLDPHSVSEDQVNVIVPPERTSTPPFTGHWDGPVPLVLIRSDYTPHTRLQVPTGDVRFIDPTNETTFLDSLVEADLIEVHIREA